MASAHGTVKQAAETLAILRHTLEYRLKQLDLT
ncbi:helix-turn-helix domain-containing protein [Alicyclobacillus ferrooxydans]